MGLMSLVDIFYLFARKMAGRRSDKSNECGPNKATKHFKPLTCGLEGG